MSQVSNFLGLPFIQPSQMQKHVTHNEALEILDALVQLAVARRDLTEPPAAPDPQERHIVAAGATGDWAGHDGDIAVWSNGGWLFRTPLAGWQAFVAAESRTVAFDGTDWVAAELGLVEDDFQNLARLGVGTAAAGTDGLAVAAASSLFTHAGTDHRLKINKAAGTDTASLVFQSDWTGHAEMGLTGGTDFAIRVSADGAGFADALLAEAGSGTVSLPGGLSLGQSVLSHYEEGTWSPNLTFGGGSAGLSYTSEGFFTRIGRLVFLQCSITLNTRGSSTGSARIAGLPFDVNPLYYTGELFFVGGVGLMAPKSRIIGGPTLRLVNSNSSGVEDLTHANFTDTTVVNVSILHTV